MKGEPTAHCHEAEFLKVERNYFQSMIKVKAKEPGSSVRNVKGNVLQMMSEGAKANLPKPETLERQLRRAGQSCNLPNPSNRHFEIPQQFSDILLHDSGRDDPERILVLGKPEHVQLLARADTWYADGTFEFVPSQFYQLYSLHCEIGNSYPPVLHFLLSNKTTRTYKRCLDILSNLVPNVQPQKLLLDFEKAAHKAFEEKFPNIEIGGCFFSL